MIFKPCLEPFPVKIKHFKVPRGPVLKFNSLISSGSWFQVSWFKVENLRLII